MIVPDYLMLTEFDLPASVTMSHINRLSWNYLPPFRDIAIVIKPLFLMITTQARHINLIKTVVNELHRIICSAMLLRLTPELASASTPWPHYQIAILKKGPKIPYNSP